jgi:hypothetical protein
VTDLPWPALIGLTALRGTGCAGLLRFARFMEGLPGWRRTAFRPRGCTGSRRTFARICQASVW